MSKMAIGGIGQVLDSVEFVKRAWSTLSLPSQLVPTVDIDELDKRIADLKAVEQWLNVNLSMLHGTIQGLEIQRGTLAAVKAFGASLGSLTPQAPAAAPARPKPTLRTPPPPAAEPEPAPEPEVKAAASAAKGGAAAPAMMPGINPGAWWNLLQQNFNQVAQAALSGGGLQDAAVTAMKAAGGLAGAAMPGLGGAVAKAAAPAKAAAAKRAAKAPAASKPAAKKKRAPARKAAKADS
ncbi:MAG: PhaM family polyhydroxyalkanoate granule multifunctional regulatory protein [Burkholderiales bacterium]